MSVDPNGPSQPNPTEHVERLAVPAEAAGQRLDRWLAAAFSERSRSEVQRWIREGRVQVDANPAKASQRLEAEQRVRVAIPAVVDSAALRAEEIPLSIVYEDENVVVVNKPAGMVVHPAPGHKRGTLVNAVLYHCPDIEGVGGERRPGIVHRLDKETSGLIVVAKNDRTLRDLQQQFQARTVYKEYLALLEGDLEPPRGRISVPIGRHPVHRQRMAVISQEQSAKARPATTDYQVLSTYSVPVRDNTNIARFSLVRAILHTGRTHQIRVHFAWYKHPVVGDTTYGYRRQRIELDRHFLHAHRLRLRLPNSADEYEFIAPLPRELQSILDQFEQQSLV